MEKEELYLDTAGSPKSEKDFISIFDENEKLRNQIREMNQQFQNEKKEYQNLISELQQQLMVKQEIFENSSKHDFNGNFKTNQDYEIESKINQLESELQYQKQLNSDLKNQLNRTQEMLDNSNSLVDAKERTIEQQMIQIRHLSAQSLKSSSNSQKCKNASYSSSELSQSQPKYSSHSSPRTYKTEHNQSIDEVLLSPQKDSNQISFRNANAYLDQISFNETANLDEMIINTEGLSTKQMESALIAFEEESKKLSWYCNHSSIYIPQSQREKREREVAEDRLYVVNKSIGRLRSNLRNIYEQDQ